MRILLGRPIEEARGTARKLAAAGHEAVIAPVLAIVPLPVRLPPGGVDAVLLTSRHALAGLAPDDLDVLRPLPAVCVGQATAAEARLRGFRDVRVGAGAGADLPALVRLTLPPARRILYLAGAVHKVALPDDLRAQGHRVTVEASYDARPCGPWPDAVCDALKAGRLDAALHFSRRSAALAVEAARGGGVFPAFARLLHACVSADAARPLIEAGIAAPLIAPRPDEASLLQAVCRTNDP